MGARLVKLVRLSILAGVLAGGASSAAANTCQPGCVEDKRECRDLAQHVAKAENSPLSVMNEQLPHIVGSGDARGRSIDVRMQERRDFENRRMERTRACDDKYMKCVRGCATSAPEADLGSVVLKPKGEL